MYIIIACKNESLLSPRRKECNTAKKLHSRGEKESVVGESEKKQEQCVGS